MKKVDSNNIETGTKLIHSQQREKIKEIMQNC